MYTFVSRPLCLAGRVTASLGVAAFLVLLASACASRPHPADPAPTAADAITAIIEEPPLQHVQWGIKVLEPATGDRVHRLEPVKHFRPASNTKLVVTAVALAELGANYRYRTEIFAPREDAATDRGADAPGDVATEDSVATLLLVVGSGDPTWSERFHPTDFAPLERLADSIQAAGIRRIAGDLVVDASRFDSVHVNPTWKLGNLPWYYAAPVAAFGIGEGAVAVTVSPGRVAGERAQLTVIAPPGAVEVRNRIRTDSAGAQARLDVAHRRESGVIEVRGSVPLDAPPDTTWLATLDPARYGARALASVLDARGIHVDGAVRVVYDTTEAARLRGRAAHADARIAVWSSPPLIEIVAGILQPSQNWIAEQLLKTLGAEVLGRGSWAAGIEVERRYLDGVAGIDSAAFALYDASGLSPDNLLTPAATVRLLRHAQRQPWGAAYRHALAAPGLDGSTLANRLEPLAGRLFAKTGTITHVNALSGYMRTDDGRELIFSILTDASGLPASRVRRAIDRIVLLISEEGGRL